MIGPIVVLVLFVAFLYVLSRYTLAQIIVFLHAASRWVRYAYFLRFSLMLWLFAPALCIGNMIDQTLTSGILVPDTMQQYLCVGFFLVSAGFASLILARVVLINGPERWDQGYNAENDARPPCLAAFLASTDGSRELASLLVAQIPNALVFIYLIVNGKLQGVGIASTAGGLLSGALLAGFFWWLANAIYYLTYISAPLPAPLPTYVLGQNAARTALFPRRWFKLNPAGGAFPGLPTIEEASTILPRVTFDALAPWVGALQGYGFVCIDGNFYLYEAHYFATIVLFSFLILYFVIWPLAAPVPAPIAAWVAIGVLLLIGASALYVFLTARPTGHGKLSVIKGWLTLGVAIFLGAVMWLYMGGGAERFPILATVLILIIALCWLLGGVAFFVDRYRLPVLTVIVLAMIIPRMLHLDRTIDLRSGGASHWAGQEEHYLSTVTTKDAAPVQTPAAILAAHLTANDGQPLIVVTSTGGGLHASAWTAAVLAHLEDKFGGEFHRHLLLMSTVSGGSVGLLTYLRELREGTLDSNPQLAFARMQSAAQCSSLESVGWGLVYYDLPKAFIPAVPYLIPPSPGVNDLDTSLPGSTTLFKDRTWSLRKSFGRNLDNEFCQNRWTADASADPAWMKAAQEASPPEKELTLRQMVPTATGSVTIPAFTMNTTSVEDGARFLLANYYVPQLLFDSGQNYRARSFLKTFGGKGPEYADLPLTTAAQMSATFPYVSSAARMPMQVDDYVGSVHFVDGGYYDNDGTASALEFLRFAMAPPDAQGADAAEKANLTSIEQKIEDAKHPLHILWIEIRNSGDNTGTGAETPGDHSGDKYPWNAFSQLSGPLLAFWQAGHESVTPRNRTGMALLEHNLSGKVEIHRVVFTDVRTKDVTGTDPLNWSLTPAQRIEVMNSADPKNTAQNSLKDQYEDAKAWFDRKASDWCGHGDSENLQPPPCPAPPAQPVKKPGVRAKTH